MSHRTSVPQRARRTAVTAALASAALLSACSTYGITRFGADEGYRRVPGVPFYVQRAVCGQETIWQQQATRVALLVEKVDASPTVPPRAVFQGEKLVPRTLAGRQAVDQLRPLVNNVSSMDEIVRRFQALPSVDLRSGEGLVLASNQTAKTMYVDYTNQYYFNAPRPVVGSSSAVAKLSPEGTLTEAQATVDDQTLTALPTLVPLKETLTSLAGLPDGQQAAFQVNFRHTLTIEDVNALHKLAQVHTDAAPPCQPRNPIVYRTDHAGYSYSFSLDNGQAKPAAPPANALQVSGQIVLPKGN